MACPCGPRQKNNREGEPPKGEHQHPLVGSLLARPGRGRGSPSEAGEVAIWNGARQTTNTNLTRGTLILPTPHHTTHDSLEGRSWMEVGLGRGRGLGWEVPLPATYNSLDGAVVGGG